MKDDFLKDGFNPGTEKFIEFGQWLMESNIRSFGPHFGMVLVQVMTDIDREIKKIDDPVIALQAKRYRDALNEVIVVGALHQKMTIEKLRVLTGNADTDTPV